MDTYFLLVECAEKVCFGEDCGNCWTNWTGGVYRSQWSRWFTFERVETAEKVGLRREHCAMDKINWTMHGDYELKD